MELVVPVMGLDNGLERLQSLGQFGIVPSGLLDASPMMQPVDGRGAKVFGDAEGSIQCLLGIEGSEDGADILVSRVLKVESEP